MSKVRVGYDGTIAGYQFARRRRPDLRRRVPPQGVTGGYLSDLLRSDVEGLIKQRTSRRIPIETLARIRRDDAVRLGMKIVKSPMSSARFWIEGEDPAEVALLQEVFVERLLDSLIRSSLLAYDFGFSAHEVTWEVGDVTVAWDEDGGTKESTFTKLYLPHSAKEIWPEYVTILREAGTYQFGGIEVKQSGLHFVLEPTNCFVFSNEPEFGDLYGTARTDFCYERWFDKQMARYAANVYFERSGAPQVLSRIPVDEEVFDEDGNPIEDPLAHYAAELPEKMRSSAVVTLPNDVDPATKLYKWTMEYLRSDPRGDEFAKWLDHLDTRILRALNCPDRLVTQGKTGAYSQSQTHAEMHLLNANEDVHAFVREVNDHLISDFKRANGLTGDARLVTSGISTETEETLKEILTNLIVTEQQAYEAIRDGRIDPEVAERLAIFKVDAERLLDALQVPVRKEPLKLPESISVTPGPAPKSEEEDPDDPDEPPARMSKIHLAREPVSLSTLDEHFRRFLLEEEAELERLSAPYRKRVEDTERSARAIALLALLKARRVRSDGTTIPGTSRFDSLVYGPDGDLLPIPKISENHDDVVAAAGDVLPSIDGTELVLEGNKGLAKRATRQIEGTVRRLKRELTELKPAGEYLDEARRLAGEHFGDLVDAGAFPETDLGNAAKRPVRPGGLVAIPKGDLGPEERKLADIEDANEDGWDRNVENITIRGNRVLAEMVGNAFFTGARLAKEKGFLDRILEWRLHPVYTDLTLEAHFRAVYRKVILEIARAAGVRYFRQIHPPVTIGGEDNRCRGHDEETRTYEGWQQIARSEFKTQDALDQFGMHYGCTAFWFPVPAETLAELQLTA